ncbi:MAG TPA: glutamate synthase subunit beta [Kiritimatiellia bacterium]|nr:glutamate synthase subunit beta [Kiritimatiellia bacterium]HMO98237.1 glutamate synthase subunit beta [Kiritimatiellia bacterium]HMP97349.1 glutamate synthase subunit beta [Kiritimatiellia bacterium]
MGKITGFKEYVRELPKKRPVDDRIKDYREFYTPFPKEKVKEQAARCMDCGVPFCHTGCPLGNIIPDWNDLVYRDNWREAIDRLHATNNFPEFTGRLCPAPCEEACVLGINEPPVTIEQIEKEIIENAFENGWVVPEPPKTRTGKKIAVIGSGPAGLAAAQQLNRAGHTVTVFERDDRIGGLLRYGIPDFKMEKWVIDRRLAIMEAEGIAFKTGVEIGKGMPVEQLRKEFDGIVICVGSTKPRDLPAPGRDLKGIHFAMEFLPMQNRWVAGDKLSEPISAKDKHVIVIGGGDTGSDCIGTSRRHGAASVTNFELLPMPSKDRPENQPWPYWPMRLRTSTSHEEGCERVFSVLTKEFSGKNGKLEQLKTVDVRFAPNPGGPPKLEEVPGSEKVWKADLVLLAMGFVGPEADSFVHQLGCQLDKFGNIQADENYMTSVPGVFVAGDARRGQSLIVWAISEGREAARCVDLHLMGASDLPTKVGHDLPRA